ncbi:MAG: hypothetical protein AAGD35_08330 [Actinomycetota bacterium]
MDRRININRETDVTVLTGRTERVTVTLGAGDSAVQIEGEIRDVHQAIIEADRQLSRLTHGQVL